jgi:mannose-6-phosphate isomerase class I
MGQDPHQPNMAWSYELIVPENGLVFKQGDHHLECSFDCLMFQENQRVLGAEAAKQFIYEWPIRLDYLDTIDGGNLSVQCHPRPDYIREQFGETYTQDETYYICNAKPQARVYLGLTEDCDPAEFRQALEESQRSGVELDIDKFVNSEPAKPHDLFRIPNGTVHCSGRGNLVLEISATPYIFTFKLYDYLRKDLNGNLRPINIEHGFRNIYFERRKKWVQENLLTKPQLQEEGDGWQKYLLYDSPLTFYNIYRVHFESTYTFHTEDHAFAVNLVEGRRVMVRAESNYCSPLSYLESMIIPAAAGNVSIRNEDNVLCKLVMVQVRPGIGKTVPLNSNI